MATPIAGAQVRLATSAIRFRLITADSQPLFSLVSFRLASVSARMKLIAAKAPTAP